MYYVVSKITQYSIIRATRSKKGEMTDSGWREVHECRVSFFLYSVPKRNKG